jgi:predicted metalloprotease with PDZ domain
MKKLIYSALAFSFLLTGCNGSKSALSNDLAVSNPIETKIEISKVKDDQVPVMINPGRFTEETVTYRLPRVVQGTYSVSDFGKYIEDFKAYDYKGNELTVSKLDTNSWAISNAKELDYMTYNVNDTFDQEAANGGGGIGNEVPFSPSGTNIEPTNYVLNLHGFIGYFDNLKNSKYKLDVVAPSTLIRTSALQETGSKSMENGDVVSSYFAPRYFDITDNPMFYGNLDVEEFLVGDIKIVLSVFSPTGKHKAETIKDIMFKMMQAQKKYLGDVNSTSRYDIYLYLAGNNEDAPRGFGALEHHTSTVVVLPEAMPDEALAESMTDVVSHEFFHIVTPLSVHSEDVHYFDYNDPTFSKHLWMYEGVTEYFATHFQIYEGLQSEDDFYAKVLGKINSASGMNDEMSFTMMSENILDEPYAGQYINVYQKGALIGMCIDILMREASNGNRSMLSLMKELSNKYGKDKPFVDDNLIAEITAMTYPSVGEFLNTHVVGTTPIDYKVFFEKVGLQVSEAKIKTNYIQNGSALIVTANPNEGTIFFTPLVEKNSFWFENGVRANDIIKSIDGEAVSLQNANAIFTKVFMWKPGTKVNVALVRDGKEIVIDKELTQSYTIGETLNVNPNATDKQNSLRKAWLNM